MISMLSSRRKAQLIVFTAFILGIAVGASGQYLLFHQAPPASSSTPADVADEMTRLLKLDPAQRSQILGILGECQKQSQDLREQTRPQFQTIRENARNHIRPLLTREQLVSFNEWVKGLDAKREKERKPTDNK